MAEAGLLIRGYTIAVVEGVVEMLKTTQKQGYLLMFLYVVLHVTDKRVSLPLVGVVWLIWQWGWD